MPISKKNKNDTFIKDSSNTKWGIRKVTDEESENLKSLKSINELKMELILLDGGGQIRQLVIHIIFMPV